MTFLDGLVDAYVLNLAAALLIGLLMGVERERHKGSGAARSPAGVRTFALVALLGGLAASSGSDALLVVAAGFVAAATLLGYALGGVRGGSGPVRRRDPGLTSEIALFLCFVLGASAQTYPARALGVAVVVTCLLAARAPMHHFARRILTDDEVRDGLIFAIAALVVLPLLPARAIDPHGWFNPHAIWRLAVLVMGLAALGHVAQRALGAQFGPPVAGFAAGFVSCSAAIAMLGGAARADRRLAGAHALGAVASILGALAYLALLLAAADATLLHAVAPPIAAASVALLVYGWVLTRFTPHVELGELTPGRAFDLRIVFVFALLVAVFAGVSGVLTSWLGPRGAQGAAAATALIDLHAASVSVAALTDAGRLDRAAGAHAILLALTTNMAIKFVAAFALGPRPYALRVSGGLALVIAAAWGTHLFLQPS